MIRDCFSIVGFFFIVASVVGCDNSRSAPTTNTDQIQAPANIAPKRASEDGIMSPGTILVANDDAWAGSDSLGFRDLMKRVQANDDVGLKELYSKGRLCFFDKGQRFRLIDTYRVPLESTDGTKHYRLQVRAIGGPLADKEMCILSAYVTPESKPTDADAKNK